MTVKRVQITKPVLILAALALTAVMVIPAVADEPLVSISGGDRTINVTNVAIQNADYSHNDQTVPGTVSLSIDDSSGSDAGWNVTLQSTAFTDGDRVIRAENFSVVGAGSPVQVEGQEIDSENGPRVPSGGGTGSLDVPRKVLNANEGFGKGTYSQELDVQLLVPGQTLAGNYGANLTVDITAGP